MRITKVTIRPCSMADPAIKYCATVYIDTEYAINGILLVERPDGTIRLRFPYLPGFKRPHRFAFTPLTKRARQNIERSVLKEYEGCLKLAEIGEDPSLALELHSKKETEGS